MFTEKGIIKLKQIKGICNNILANEEFLNKEEFEIIHKMKKKINKILEI